MSRRSVAVTFRFTPEELEDIDQRARTHQLSRTAYLVAVATGNLESGPNKVAKHVFQLEERIERLERFMLDG